MTKNWYKEFKNWFATEDMVVEGHTFAGRLKLGSHPLVLNGAGLRNVDGRNIYALGLYLPEKTTRADTAKALLGARRVEFFFLDQVHANEFIGSLKSAIGENTNQTSYDFIQEELAKIEALMTELTLERADIVDFDWIPNKGSFIYYNGEQLGGMIMGKAVYDAVLSIWLGKHTIQSALKEDLLKA